MREVALSAQVDQTPASERLLTTLCTFFGVLALLLASVGLYGVLSYAVAQRTQEIGIRMALGATDRNVLWLVLRQSLTVILTGIAIGLSLAILSTRLISGFLFSFTRAFSIRNCQSTPRCLSASPRSHHRVCKAWAVAGVSCCPGLTQGLSRIAVLPNGA
jgi:ABC-type antimicrobial peptide transport system permease subunit